MLEIGSKYPVIDNEQVGLSTINRSNWVDFVSELIAKIEKGKVLERDRARKRPIRKRSRKPVGRTKKQRASSLEAKERTRAWRASYEATIVGMYHHFVRACKAKQKMYLLWAGQAGARGDEVSEAKWLAKTASWQFELSLDTWVLTWLSCCDIIRVEGEGTYAKTVTVPAWKARGRNYNTDVQLGRKDVTKPWTSDNIQITYLGKVISKDL